MNHDQAQEYMAKLSQVQADHGALVEEYARPEFHLRGQDESLEAELTRVGELMAYSPPMVEVEPGVWEPKRKGLTHTRETNTPLLVKPMGDVIQVEQWDAYLADRDEPPSVEPFVLGVKDQNGNGSCTCESGTGGMEIVNNFSRGNETVFNPLFSYRLVNGGRDSGSSLEDVIAALQSTGACPESVYGRSHGWRAKPPQEAFDAAAEYRLGEVYACRSKAEFGTALIQRKPIHFWYDSHAVCAVGLLSKTQFRWLNSWDYSWGDKGYGTMALSSLGYRGFYVFGSTNSGK